LVELWGLCYLPVIAKACRYSDISTTSLVMFGGQVTNAPLALHHRGHSHRRLLCPLPLNERGKIAIGFAACVRCLSSQPRPAGSPQENTGGRQHANDWPRSCAITSERSTNMDLVAPIPVSCRNNLVQPGHPAGATSGYRPAGMIGCTKGSPGARCSYFDSPKGPRNATARLYPSQHEV
jgi:hypothetical protein